MNFKKPKFWDYKKVSVWVFILYPLTIIYQFIYWIIKIFKPLSKFTIPIISVGNIYLGGTGKTPLAREIFKITKSLNKNPAFIKKPYPYLKDEIKMLEKTGKIFTSKDRATSISLCINNNHNIAILDDGFQDFSIKPDLSILCFNSKQLIGNGFIFPSGPLRENFSSIKRADCIFINGDKNLEFEDKIKEVNASTKIFYSVYKAKNLDKFKNKKVIAFAGIGNPQNFFDLLKENNINVKKEIPFPDHHNYTESDYNYLVATNESDELLLTTEKDYSRLNEKMKKNFGYVEIDLEIENKNEFINLIKSKL
tara:strand:- start:18 stop:944 length:927 start_codon:yes stop_codon:yes gene_type:complete